MIDPVDEFLDRPVPLAENESLKAALRERTTQLVRRRLWRKRALLAAALAACFAAGMATTWWLLPPAEVAQEPQPVVAEKKDEPKPQPKAEAPAMPRTAAVVERQARAQPDSRVANLRQAAKLYLAEDQDYAAALRCYTQALDAGGPEALAPSPDDDWLEIALKNARHKEKRQ
jgi:hypothetical protein